MAVVEKIIWTIGHSTRSISNFIGLLQSFRIETLVDIRHYPGSRRYPHFNEEALQQALMYQNIRYIHSIDLGGRRKPVRDSRNTAWRHAAFRGYADYMETDAFARAAGELEAVAEISRTAYMCSEAVWWRCHRALLSDYLKVKEWKVFHIMDTGKSTEHPFTSPARIVDGQLIYNDTAFL